MSHKAGDGKNLAYDEKLLDVAPQVTKGQRQEGYDADILNPTAPPATRSVGHGYTENNTDVESGTSPHQKHLAAGGYDSMEPPAKKPFWKTPKGLIALAIVALVIIAAAVGGGVGGTAGKHNNNAAAVFNSTTSSSATGGDHPHPSPTSNSAAPACTQDSCPAETASPATESSPNGITQTPTTNGSKPTPTSQQGDQ